MKKIVVAAISAAVCSFVLSGCASYPKTRSEFTGHPDIQRTVFTVPRGIDAVVASVNKQADTCVNTGIQVSGKFTAMSQTLQLMTIKRVSPKLAELEYRQRTNNSLGEPEGGFFLLAADFVASGAKSTQVTLYHGSYQETLTGAVRKWAEGDVSSCHGYGRS